MRKAVWTLGLAGLLLPGIAGAANIFEKVGTFGGQFLKIPVGARAEGMGGAFVGRRAVAAGAALPAPPGPV